MMTEQELNEVAERAVHLTVTLRHRVNELETKIEKIDQRLSALDGRKKRKPAAARGAAPPQGGGGRRRRGT